MADDAQELLSEDFGPPISPAVALATYDDFTRPDETVVAEQGRKVERFLWEENMLGYLMAIPIWKKRVELAQLRVDGP